MLTPEQTAFLARLDSWRAKSAEEQAASFLDARPDVKATLSRVRECPSRGPVLPVSQQDESCGCGELSGCSQMKGKIPGRVSLQMCLTCVTADTVRT